MKNKIYIIILILFSMSLSGCSNTTIESKIVSTIENNCKQFPCEVQIDKITDFDWDKMHVFDYGASIEQVNEVIETHIPNQKPLTRKIVFTKNNKVIHYEELPTNIEGVVDNEIGFDNSGNYFHKTYKVEDAIFEAQKYFQGDKTVYHLNKR